MGGKDIGIIWNDIRRANLTCTCWSRVFIFLPVSFLSSFFFFSALSRADLKMPCPASLCVMNSSNVKLLDVKLLEEVGHGLDAAFAAWYREPHDPQNKALVPIFLAPQTEQNILKKKKSKIIRNQHWLLFTLLSLFQFNLHEILNFILFICVLFLLSCDHSQAVQTPQDLIRNVHFWFGGRELGTCFNKWTINENILLPCYPIATYIYITI